MRKSVRIGMALLFAITLGCSNSDNDDDASARQGRFIDSPVSGLDFSSSTGQGRTSGTGAFVYAAGDAVEFYLGGAGGLFLGSAAGADYLTPMSLAADDQQGYIFINIARLLLALDADQDSSNGIQLADEDIDAARSLSLGQAAFDLQPNDFSGGPLQAYIQARITDRGRSLPDAAAALIHLNCSLQDIEAGREPDGRCEGNDGDSGDDGDDGDGEDDGGNGGDGDDDDGGDDDGGDGDGGDGDSDSGDDGSESGSLDAGLLPLALESLLLGCDYLDAAQCQYPFPNDYFTRGDAATATGRRVSFNILGMPRNTAGKPIDPTEWNRNDGFSPGAMIMTYVPGLDHARTGAVTLTDISTSLQPGAPVQVFEVDPESGDLTPQLIWSEMDSNADVIVRLGDVGGPEVVERPDGGRSALLIRPARNLKEGHRYIVALRNLLDADGNTIPAPDGFRVFRDGIGSLIPTVESRRAHMEDILGKLDEAGIERESLYLAWDFTVASQPSLTGRLLHMRDDAFAALGDAAPAFSIDTVTSNPNAHIARRIEGTFTVPSYVVPADPSPLDRPELKDLLDQAGEIVPDVDLPVDAIICNDLADCFNFAASGSLPPNRLYYDPTDAGLGGNPPYGDGLPDRPYPGAELTLRFTCNIPKSALGGGDFSDAHAADLRPARASLYGHGLLGGQGEVNNSSHVATMSNAHNIMFCATDWFGFASGDLLNVASVLIDLSLFPVIPDGSQQGMLNKMFLARLMTHPQGFAANQNFQVEGVPVFDTSAVFYDGNSQGGIMGGVVVATSPDVHRGVLGVPGMNYSTLLQRSVDFDLYSVPLYLSYLGDLDRMFLFSLMQMLWDRSENNGYAQHLNRSPLAGLDGDPMPVKRVLLHPAFADHQVTMWSADVMARTMSAVVDRSRIDAARHPDEVEYFGLTDIHDVYLPQGNLLQHDGSALVVWDEPWTTVVDSRCGGNTTPTPPVGNVPPREGDDPHECPRREVAAQCQKSHFLQAHGAVIDVTAVTSNAACPALAGQ